MEEKISLFRTITQDQDIDQAEVVKFIDWGRGDIQQALNYYYTNLQKGRIKRATRAKPAPMVDKKEPLLPAKQAARQDQPKEPKQAENGRASDMSMSSDDDQMSGSVNAFSVLKKGSVQHKKTHDFIKKVREVYKLPIRGKPQKQLLQQSNSCLPDNEGRMSQEIMLVDNLNQAFDSDYIGKILDKHSAETTTPNTLLEKNETRTRKSNKETKPKNQLIELSVSEEIDIQDPKAEYFKDIQDFEYKHVYSSSSAKKHPRPQAPPAVAKPTNEMVEENLQQQDKIKKQKPASKPSKIQRVSKQKQTVFPIAKSQSSVLEPKNDAKVAKHQHKTIQQEQLYIGSYFPRGLCSQKRKYEPSCHGEQVVVQGYIEESKGKKKKVGRKPERNMNMRVRFEGRPVGRVVDQEVRIIMPLIEKDLIKVEFYLHDMPMFADLLKPFTLKARIYLKRKIIEEPVMENFQPQEDDKQRVEQLSALFSKLNLPVLTPPLIKAKSKYIKHENTKKSKKTDSIDIMVYGGSYQEDLNKIQEMEQKNKKQADRLRSDPLFAQKQKSIRDMMARSIESNQKAIKQREIQTVQEEGHIKKKVIEIDSQQDKSKLAELIQLHEENCQPYYPQANFVSQLYPYQALALGWMLRREGFLSSREEKEQLHPLWTEYEIPNNLKYNLYFNELTGQVCVKRPVAVIKCRGGILADEMGLGKTVMMTSLIVSNPRQPAKGEEAFAGTLVIVPLTLLSQWESEIARHAKGQRVAAYYSTDRRKLLTTLHEYDVVISTYGTISHEFAQGFHNKKQGIYRYKWHRIILDEAHYIKGRIIQTSKAVYELSGTYRWCLTGTPIQNTVTDIFSLLHFIKYTPWSQFACWNRFIVRPLQEQDESIYQVLRTILRQVFLRRTKNSQGPDGQPIISLPPRVSKVELLTMSQKEREFYDSIYQSSRSDFDSLIDKGILEAKYMQVLQMLMRLRQICCHPILFKSVSKFSKNNEEFQNQLNKMIKRSHKKSKNQEAASQDSYYQPIIDADNEQFRIKTSPNTISEQYFKQVLEKVATGNLDNCIICLSQPQDPVVTCCLHIFCKACNIRQVEQKGSCSFCRMALGKEDFIHLPREDRLNLKKETKKESLFLSTKMIALNEHIAKFGPDDKAVVFSQFLGMLDLLEDQLDKNKIKYVRMEGSNTHKQRTKIVKAFQQDPQVRVFLVSLKTAGVGLNLVAANKVFLMDPWWNPAVEEQAIERVHRIGQKKSVEIVRFIMDRTIEARMLELNTEKKALSQNVLNQRDDKEPSEAKHKIEKLRYLMENY